MTARPRFSIVIPTRNRAGLLRQSLRAVLDQTHMDFEVVVSDNASVDDTAAVVAAADDPRVRYVRSDASLSQPNSWNFALSHAAGEWVTLMGDDDAFVPSFLSRLDGVIGDDVAPIAWGEAYYYDPVFRPAWLKPEAANILTIEPFTGSFERIGADVALTDLFRMVPHSPPGMFNAAVHWSTLDEVRSMAGRVCSDPDPFITSGIAVLLAAGGYRRLDVPLLVRGITEATLSLNFVHNTREHEGVREYDHEDLLTLAPLHERTLASLIAESLLRMKVDLPAALTRYDLDLVQYFVKVRLEVDHGGRRSDEGLALQEWKRVLAEQPADVLRAVARELRHRRLATTARTLARRVPGARRVRGAVRGDVFRCADGREVGFHDIQGASTWLDTHILPSPASVMDPRAGNSVTTGAT